MRYLLILIIILFAYSTVPAQQVYPVQATVQLAPPYAPYLADYAVPGNDKLKVILLLRDLTQPSYQLRLHVSVKINGRVLLRTAPWYNPPPITVSTGTPTVISGAELAPYLDSRNLEFVSYDRNQYEKTKTLPEGAFELCVTAYDYYRQQVQVSQQGCSFYYLAKNEPPLINMPTCGSRVPNRFPQQIIFSWLPRNTASPNSTANTEYDFNLYEIRVKGSNPNDVVLNTPPIYSTTLQQTQLIYGPTEPMLIDSMYYVWQVRARDKSGRDLFRNNGYSEVCFFTYGGADPNFTHRKLLSILFSVIHDVGGKDNFKRLSKELIL